MTHACRELSAIGRTRDFERTFICPEESERYAGSLEQLVFSRFRREKLRPTVIEFGSGTGAPVITAIKDSDFAGIVHGYEINPDAADIAEQAIEGCSLEHRYIIHNKSFFDTERRPPSDYLVANPPYIPCDDRALLTLPDLCGGPDGTEVSKRLLAAGYPYPWQDCLA